MLGPPPPPLVLALARFPPAVPPNWKLTRDWYNSGKSASDLLNKDYPLSGNQLEVKVSAWVPIGSRSRRTGWIRKPRQPSSHPYESRTQAPDPVRVTAGCHRRYKPIRHPQRVACSSLCCPAPALVPIRTLADIMSLLSYRTPSTRPAHPTALLSRSLVPVTRSPTLSMATLRANTSTLRTASPSPTLGLARMSSKCRQSWRTRLPRVSSPDLI